MYSDTDIIFTQHAEQRMAQRGVSMFEIGLLLAFGVRSYAGDGCTRITLTDRAINRCGQLALKDADKLRGISMILAADKRTITSVMHYTETAHNPGCLRKSRLAFRRVKR